MSDNYITYDAALNRLGKKDTSQAGSKLGTAFDWFETLYDRLPSTSQQNGCATITHEGVELRIKEDLTKMGVRKKASPFLLHEDDVAKAAGILKKEEKPMGVVTQVEGNKATVKAGPEGGEVPYVHIKQAVTKSCKITGVPLKLRNMLEAAYEKAAREQRDNRSYEGFLTVPARGETLRLHREPHGRGVSLSLHPDDVKKLAPLYAQMKADNVHAMGRGTRSNQNQGVGR